jgi:thioredoxin 1
MDELDSSALMLLPRRPEVDVCLSAGGVMSNILRVSEANFAEQVLQSKLPVLVEFGAVWCGPCKRMEPELENLGKSLAGRLRLAKLDVDEATNVTIQYQVMSVPTMILFVNGEACVRMSGYQPGERMMAKIEAYL